jgi:predicted O-methyltransferase YrrM
MEDVVGYPGFKHNHSHFIAELVKQINCKTYLELGIYDGITLSLVQPHVERIISVDIKDVRRYRVGEFHLETTDSFFKHFNEKVDVVFIDADHNFESVKNSIKLLNEFGMIILHDTDPMEKMYLDPGYCGDSYKMDDWIRENYLDLDVMTLPLTQAGLSIVKRKSDKRINKFLK